MRIDRRIVVVAAGLGVLVAVGGAGIAQAVSSGDEQVGGPAADRAAAAAVAAVGGGTALKVERQDGDGAGAYEVEVRRPDGSQVEIHLNAQFERVGSAADDDNGPESEGDDD